MIRKVRAFAAAVLISFAVAGPSSAEEAPNSLWYGTAVEGAPTVNLWFFWSEGCPHCRKAKPFIQDLQRELPWLHVRSLDVARPVGVTMYERTARLLEMDAGSVPAFFFCGQADVGFGSAETTGERLRRQLVACHQRLVSGNAEESDHANAVAAQIDLPLVGKVSPDTLSLPLFTAVIAALDAFNPCAFFVLLFLLSLLVHTPGRLRMSLVGGVFVTTSGVVYFLFMAAWLNLFLLVGEMRWVTTAAAIVAILFGAINLKDFVWFGRGVSLSMSGGARTRVFARIRKLIGTASFPAMLAGTAALALAANAYELVCTSGLPMVFARVLTLNELPTAVYYLYLLLYNVIYIVPLAAIVAVFVITLGTRKLQEREARALKLLSGLMMFGLGVALLADPAALSDLRVAVAILGLAVLATAAASFAERWFKHKKAT